jgi:hypothetical protein
VTAPIPPARRRNLRTRASLNRVTDRLCEPTWSTPMIRAVADRIAARARPAYIGRHRRARPVLHRVFKLELPSAMPAEEAAQ